MVILLDIDGVLVTTPAWRAVELQDDGFMKFNARAANNLGRIIDQTQARIVLTTSHRINYSLGEWQVILQTRGINSPLIAKINDVATLNCMGDRADEIAEWVASRSDGETYVIIDDDLSINRLPEAIKARCVLTKPLIGLDEEAMTKVLDILLTP
ncbi:HAD domain-containing protein [Hymenobacter terricola]|uniref:HAD domain-containing protein n=1 Tax=Hymenobacter terricola TaxID=2819236 RepID=UPI001B317862|nr:HAD domain-containing protein [Hymenobacter terricola]